MPGHDVDVLIVRNSTKTPYLVIDDVTDPPGRGNQPRTVRANAVDTRVQDTNPAIDKTADLDKTEYLWRKRFDVHRTALDRVAVFLDAPKDAFVEC
jgi:hypothetical protein